jgi:hypothetical protein
VAVHVHAARPGPEVEADRRELSLAVALTVHGSGFDVQEISCRGLDDSIPGGSGIDVDRAPQDVGDNVVIAVVCHRPQPTGGSPRWTATVNPSRSMAAIAGDR